MSEPSQEPSRISRRRSAPGSAAAQSRWKAKSWARIDLKAAYSQAPATSKRMSRAVVRADRPRQHDPGRAADARLDTNIGTAVPSGSCNGRPPRRLEASAAAGCSRRRDIRGATRNPCRTVGQRRFRAGEIPGGDEGAQGGVRKARET